MKKPSRGSQTPSRGGQTPSRALPSPSPERKPPGRAASWFVEFASRRPWQWVALAMLGAIYASLAIHSLLQESVTADEFGHLPVGYQVLTTGDFRYCDLNPPLMNVLSALPLLMMDMSVTGREEPPPAEFKYRFWANGYAFAEKYPVQYQRLFTAARCVTVAFVGLLGVLLFVWAQRLASDDKPDVKLGTATHAQARGVIAGLLAACLVWFSPNIMAHARLVTTDAGLACFVALAMFAFHAYLRRPSLIRALAAGAALGAAQLVKFSAVYLYLAMLVAAVAWRWMHPDQPRRRLLGGLAIIVAVSVLTINAGYLFQDVAPTVGSLTFKSGPFKWLQKFLPDWTPLPLPASYVRAFDLQTYDAAQGDPSFLSGMSYSGGRWDYFLVLLAAKTPIPMMVLAVFAVTTRNVSGLYRRFATVLLLAPALIFLLMFSLASNKQLGLRMILPAAPLFWLWVASSVVRLPWPRLSGIITAPLLLWLVIETRLIHPHYLAYFNQLAGGPSKGYRLALDSNLDWGQDLIGLKRFMDDRGIKDIQLYYFGRVPPEIYGIEYTVPTKTLERGWLAVSASLTGRSYVLYDHGKRFEMGPIELPEDVFGPPTAVIGNSILVYQVRQRMGLQLERKEKVDDQ